MNLLSGDTWRLRGTQLRQRVDAFWGHPSQYLRRAPRRGEKLPWRTRFSLNLILLSRMLMTSELLTYAASLSYTLIFAVVPLLTSTLAFLTAFPGLSEEKDSLKTVLYGWLLPGAVREVEFYLDQFTAAAAAAGTVSSLIFLVSILFLFQSMERQANRIWHVERARTWGQRLQGLAVFFLFVVVGGSLLVLLSQEAQHLTEQLKHMPLPDLWQGWKSRGFAVAELMVSWVMFGGAARVLPATRVRFRSVLISGVVAGSLWQLLKEGFSWYVTDVASYSNIYGAMGTVPIFMLWLYLSMAVLLLGCSVAFVHQNLLGLLERAEAQARGHSGLTFQAVQVCVGVFIHFEQGKGACQAETLAGESGLDLLSVEASLHQLHSVGVVLKTPMGLSEGWIPALPATGLTLASLVQRLGAPGLEVPSILEDAPFTDPLRTLFDAGEARLLAPWHSVNMADLLQQVATPSQA